MSLTERLSLYSKIETHRKRSLLVYVTSKRDGVSASMASDALPFLVDQLDLIDPESKALDFLIASFGGDPMVAWRIMSLIRQRLHKEAKVSVLIPQSAYSAATLVALGADEIVMHPNSHLGPIDMQITTVIEGHGMHFSTEDISAFLEFVRENLSITDQKHLRSLFEITCKEVGTLGVGFTARSSKLAVALGERLLGMHMKDDDNGTKKTLLLEKLSRQFHSHAYPINRTEAIEIELAVNKERDPELEKLMWALWLDLEEALKERQPFSPIMELLKSPQAGPKLLSEVPQLDSPGNAPGPMLKADMAALSTAITTKVEPVDFEQIVALMESPRLANRGVKRGKILASTMPDLRIQYNELVTFRGWEKTHP